MAGLPIDSRTLQRIGEMKIEQAIKNGQFRNLPGFGKPFEFDELNYDPNWWIKAKLKRENLASRVSPQFLRELDS
ncbi:MAG: DUF1992 domain-containing protein [Planctomycetota bacterium]